MALSDSQTGRRPFRRRSGPRPPANPEPPSLTQITFPACRAHYPGGPDQVRSLVDELRVPARVSSLSVRPSPLSWRVGVHITTFEACSSFTRVTACKVAHLPFVGFIARLPPSRLPGSGARKLPSSTNNLLGWGLPPLVTCAFEAHTTTPSHNRYRKLRNFRLADNLPGGRRGPVTLVAQCRVPAGVRDRLLACFHGILRLTSSKKFSRKTTRGGA